MDPFTIAAGISAIGSLFKGITGFFGGNSRAEQEKAAAAQARQEAGVQSSQALAQGNAVAARAATQAAANGGGFDGSALGVIQYVGDHAMFNARAAAYRGATQSRADLYNAGVDRADGLDSLIGGGIGAIGAGFQGAAQSATAKALSGGGSLPRFNTMNGPSFQSTGLGETDADAMSGSA